jgi:CheY-like chemotaxis protein
MPQPKILVVDDDPDLSEALQIWFAKRDYDVTFAANGHEGMMILRSGEPVDLVLTDFMMPELNGMELLRLVKSHVKLFGTKIVVMSSNSNPEFRKRAAELGAVDYLSKVDTAKTIVEKVVKILGDQGGDHGGAAAPAEEPPVATLPLAEIRLAAESLLSLMQVIGLVEGMPAAAASAVASAQKLAEKIHTFTAQPSAN